MNSDSRIASPANHDGEHRTPTRRTMLSALAVLPAAGGALIGAEAAAAFPIVPSSTLPDLMAHWRSVITAFGDPYGDHSDEETGAFSDELYDIMEQITETPAADVRDLLAKVEVARHELVDDLSGTPPDHMEALLLSLLDDIQCLAGAAGGIRGG